MRNIYVNEGIIKMKIGSPVRCGSWDREQYLKKAYVYNKNAYKIKHGRGFE